MAEFVIQDDKLSALSGKVVIITGAKRKKIYTRLSRNTYFL
jgi:hypothetical protein